MELPQSRPLEAKGRKKPTHDFLSACSNKTVQPDLIPPSQGDYLKTYDFLQPLERVGTRACVDTTTTDHSSELKLPHVQNQHVLPGGIGTYTISHIPYLYHHQRAPKPDVSPIFTVVDENSNSNCSSFAAKGFTLWDESIRNTRKDIVQERTNIRDAAATMGQWQGMEQRSSFSSRSCSQTSSLKSQSFMEMIRSAKGSSQEDDLDDEDEEFVMKKENNTCQRVDLRVKVDGKGLGNDQKPNTPRSKHSATEQRRRSKINDRFQMLRQLIPNSDQKRDKASFLLEVIEYIHFLQEKVNKHEVVPYQGKLISRAMEGTVPVEMDQHCLNKAISQRKNYLSPASQICPVSSDAEMESDEKLREEEELSVHKGAISISSIYSQGLLKTLTETLQTSRVDLSKASISVQIKLSKQQKNKEVHRRVRPRLQNGDDMHNNVDNNSNTQTQKQNLK